MKEFKVPVFISEEFNKLNKEKKEELIQRYKNWEQLPITQELIKYLESQYNYLLKDDENTLDVETQFAFSNKLITNRAKRNLLRDLYNKINWRL